MLDAALAVDPQAQPDLGLVLPAPDDEVDQEGEASLVELEEPVLERSPAGPEVIHGIPLKRGRSRLATNYPLR
jgi:hypothetical protein